MQDPPHASKRVSASEFGSGIIPEDVLYIQGFVDTAKIVEKEKLRSGCDDHARNDHSHTFINIIP